jgi:serine/threonine protein kinase
MLRDAIEEGRITAGEADVLGQICDGVSRQSDGRFRARRFIGETLHFSLIEGFDARRQRPVLMTVASPSRARAGEQLGLMREMLGRVRDDRIGSEYGGFEVDLAGGRWQCCVSTFHGGAQPLGTFLIGARYPAAPASTEVVRHVTAMLRGLCEQVHVLHDSGYTHGDITPTNILVDAGWQPHLIDFDLLCDQECAVLLNAEGGTARFDHPDKLARLAAAASGNALPPSHDERISWDIYALGQTLRTVFDTYAPAEFFRCLSTFHQRYFALMFSRMLGGQNRFGESALGIPTDRFRAIAYQSVAEIELDLRKLDGTYSIIQEVPELDLAFPDRLQVSSRFEVVLTPRLKRILQTRELQALAGVRQLGLINLVFPSANHSRFEHALGTYASTCQYVRWLLRDDENPIFIQLVTARHARALLASALLHDIGHFPLAHDFEDAEFSLFDHEARTIRMLRRPDCEAAAVLAEPEPAGWGMDPTDVAEILAAGESPPSLVSELLRSVISGPIDADKVDYLVRDSERLSVRYGEGIDVPRLGVTLTSVMDFRHADPKFPRVSIGVQEKGVGAAETVAFARYAMFRNVYWHHSYRVIKAMVQWIVWEFLRRHWLRTSSVRTFRDSVHRDLGRTIDGRPGEEQLPLFAENETFPALEMFASLVPFPERVVLEWCARGVASAEAMVAAILERGLYRRVLVMSVERDLSRDLWKGLQDFFVDAPTEAGNGGWMRRYLLARRYQQFLLETIVAGEAEGSYLVGADEQVAKFVAACGQRQVVLVDFPNPERARQPPLRYLVEEERRHRQLPVQDAIGTEPSRIFEAIADQFTETIGKVRIFVDPRFAPLIVDRISRASLQAGFERLLEEARLCQPREEREFVTDGVQSSGEL